MLQKQRSRPLILLTIIGLFFMIPCSTACAEIIGILLSTDTAGSVAGIDFGPEDILGHDSGGWYLYFDGSYYGLDPAKHDIEAFALPFTVSETLSTENRTIYLSFYQNKVKVTGLGSVLGQEVIKFTETITDGYGFERYFDGTDVGLTEVSEKIDGLEVLDDTFLDLIDGTAPLITNSVTGTSPDEDECQAIFFISTTGVYSIPARYTDGVGKITGDGSDMLAFCAFQLGEDTAGVWIPVFDGMEEGMPKNYLDSLSLPIFGAVFAFTTPGDFAVDAAAGGHSEVYGYDGDFSGPTFSAPAEGLDAFVDGLHLPIFCFDDCIP